MGWSFWSSPKGTIGPIGHLHLGFQSHFNYGPLKRWICSEVDLPTRTQALGAKNSILEDWHSWHMPRVDEDGGMYGKWNSYTTQGWNRKQGHPKNEVGPSNGCKGHNKRKWGQGKLRPPNDKENLVNKKPSIKKAKRDLSKVKCFN